MKKINIIGILVLIIFSCQLFEPPYTDEELNDGQMGRPESYYQLPSLDADMQTNQLQKYILNSMNGGIFGSNEIDAAVTANNIISLYPFPFRNSMTTNGFPDSPADHWEVSETTYKDNLDFAFWYWADSGWGWGNHQIDGGDHEGTYVGDVDQAKQHATQEYMAANILLEAGYVEEAILAYYHIVVENYRRYENTDYIFTVFTDDGYASWSPAETAYTALVQLIARFGKVLGISYTGGKFEGLGTAGDAWVYPDYSLSPGYFVPYSE